MTEETRRDPERDPLRIAVVGTRGVPSTYGGMEKVTETLYTILADRGHEVTVYCRSDHIDQSVASHRGIQQVCVPAIKRRSAETISHIGASLAHATLHGRYDLIHLQALAPGLFAPFRALWRTATVSTIHGLDWQRAKWKGTGRAVLHRAERSIVRHIDDVIVVSRDLEAYFRTTYGKQTTYIPNGVHHTAPDAQDGSASLQRYGLARGTYVVFIGRLVPEKRVDDLIRAFRRVTTEHRLVLVGEGGYTDGYVATLRALAANDARIVFTGRQDGAPLAALFSGAAAFVSPSELEGLPIAVLESMEFGVPAIVSAIPPHRELLGGVPGYDLFFPVTDVDAIADRIQRVLDHPAHYRAVAEQAQALVRREYSWAAVADRTEEVYRRVARRAGARTHGNGSRSVSDEAPGNGRLAVSGGGRDTQRPVRAVAEVAAARRAPSAVDLATRDCSVVQRATQPADGVRLSVVVPSYNTGTFVCATVRSILRQSMASLEVIVADDGSTDDSIARVLAMDDPRVTVVHQRNRGLPASRNTGILFARAPYIGFCDSDDLWHPEKAARHLAMMEADPSIGLTFSFSEYLTEDGRGTGQLLASTCDEPTARALVARNHIGNGSTPIVRRECFEQAGMFDESLKSCEDLEMWVRIAACTEYRLRRIPEVLTGYRVRSGSISMTVPFDIFLEGARRAAERYIEVVPDLPLASVRRGYAEALRIASRKAFTSGDLRTSRRLLIAAVRHCPVLPLVDARAFAMVVLHTLSAPLSASQAQAVYDAGRAAVHSAHAAVLGSKASGAGCGPIWTAAVT